MKRGARQRTMAKSRVLFHCETCESVVKYTALVMRYNATTDQIRTPSGLVINIKRPDKP
jgi:hypothetical protein